MEREIRRERESVRGRESERKGGRDGERKEKEGQTALMCERNIWPVIQSPLSSAVPACQAELHAQPLTSRGQRSEYSPRQTGLRKRGMAGRGSVFLTDSRAVAVPMH
ncbi:UNVERIFIED_CONTAM: hypothetical protein FKN15_009338 [Acipenser sinensis]